MSYFGWRRKARMVFRTPMAKFRVALPPKVFTEKGALVLWLLAKNHKNNQKPPQK